MILIRKKKVRFFFLKKKELEIYIALGKNLSREKDTAFFSFLYEI